MRYRWAALAVVLTLALTPQLGKAQASSGTSKRPAVTLGQNFPNPFNPTTTLTFAVPAGTRPHVTLTVYDPLGRAVARPVDGVREAGEYAVPFSGAGLSSGVYFYTLLADGSVRTRKMMLLK